MKRFLLLPLLTMLLALVSTTGSARALRALNDDTIVVRLPNQATMTLYVKDRAQLRELRNYKLDSLMLLLDTYIAQAEKASKNSSSEQVTMEFYPAKDQPGKRVPEQIRITMHNDSQTDRPAKKGERVDVTVGRVFGVTVEENSADGNDRVSVRVGSSAKSDSIRMAERKAKIEERANRPVHSNFTIDLGLNALTNKQQDQNGNSLDLRPWGSRYISFNWVYDIRLGAKGSPLYLRTGPELAFNNYMLDNNRRFVNQDGVTTLELPTEVGRNYEKSKLAVSTINLPLMLALSFRDDKGRNSFRVGAGGFVGYRLGSHTKLKYEEDGNTKKDKDRGSYNLEDFQYGLQGTMGIRGIDLFAKYSLNELFKNNRGPQAQAISFGVVLFN
ncbi:outer membrane beta-barrel protein [Hymenobacter psychrophilus]|uniref:Outer membrane protein beta-barrel domain-containing protein n=1 Tax=Hymenobacter psychrophilus TaxID=651662 RepID=A0A1H3LQ34_9BACT|nr:outer membrane beta-barrel protein [Hymenobacter psychrophilus]SDY66436.1 Outer membrane protein beta-barrel domain-containing protein [Hymenobacter psychrophilus]